MTAHLISRAEISAEQQEWEIVRRDARQITVLASGALVLRGVNLHNFAELVGPERYWNHQERVGAVEIVEPTSLANKLKEAAHWVLDKII